jgi:hypothetical protein
MLAVVDDLCVDLISHHEEIVLNGKVRNRLEVILGEHAARGIGGAIDDQELGARGDQGLEF